MATTPRHPLNKRIADNRKAPATPSPDSLAEFAKAIAAGFEAMAANMAAVAREFGKARNATRRDYSLDA